MLIGRVRGTVVSSTKHQCLNSLKLLIVQGINTRTLEYTDDFEVVADSVGAGEGEIVMCCRGSSARNTDEMKEYPVDYSIVSILDSIDFEGKKVFEKYTQETIGGSGSCKSEL